MKKAFAPEKELAIKNGLAYFNGTLNAVKSQLVVKEEIKRSISSRRAALKKGRQLTAEKIVKIDELRKDVDVIFKSYTEGRVGSAVEKTAKILSGKEWEELYEAYKAGKDELEVKASEIFGNGDFGKAVKEQINLSFDILGKNGRHAKAMGFVPFRKQIIMILNDYCEDCGKFSNNRSKKAIAHTLKLEKEAQKALREDIQKRINDIH